MTGTELVLIALASVVGGLIKGVTGLGYPLVAVPLITLAVGVEDAVVVVAVPNLVANAALGWHARDGRTASRDLDRLLAAGVVGAVLGTFALTTLPEDPLLVVLIVTVVVFIVQFLRDPDLRIDPATSRRWSPVAGLGAGVMQGALGISGPVVATWLHGYRLEKAAYVFSVVSIFGLTGAVQIVVLGAQGEFDADRLVAAAVAGAAVAVVLPIGTRLRDRVDGASFERAVLAVLAVSVVSLAVRVLT